MHCGIGGVSAAPAENHSLVEAVASEVHQDRADGTHDSTHNNVAEFAATPEGLFAPLQGIMVNAEQATKIFNNKKVTIVVRDCAQAIWGEEALACKTVSGCSVPVEETKQLTPQKVHDVNGEHICFVEKLCIFLFIYGLFFFEECLAYWGKSKKGRCHNG
ncbi:uncharacterized protein LOC142786495 isoform X1 [Rhipicephalus microplus]|uniref:uncharacterized protein LOC142786495 isoform X1 n=1 Tax=Rhipicephalus microplus TaxID=6941 RepID=UPI003F6C0911